MADFDLAKGSGGGQGGNGGTSDAVGMVTELFKKKAAVQNTPNILTNSLVGTDAYLCPEIISGVGTFYTAKISQFHDFTALFFFSLAKIEQATRLVSTFGVWGYFVTRCCMERHHFKAPLIQSVLNRVN